MWKEPFLGLPSKGGSNVPELQGAEGKGEPGGGEGTGSLLSLLPNCRTGLPAGPGEGVRERGWPAGQAGGSCLSRRPAALLSVIAPPPSLQASSGSAPAAGLKSDPGGRRALPVDSEPGHSLGPRPPPQPGPLSWRHQGPGARGPGNPRKGLARPTGHRQSRSRKACRKGYFGPAGSRGPGKLAAARNVHSEPAGHRPTARTSGNPPPAPQTHGPRAEREMSTLRCSQ